MAFWLVKSEPHCWSFADHMAASVAEWDGVRNHQANGYMKEMQCGDRAFFYHSVKEKRIVGILEVCGLWRPDPSDEKGRFGLVDFRALCALPRPVTLEEIKQTPGLENLALLRQARLSVCPVPDDAWEVLCRMGELDPDALAG